MENNPTTDNFTPSSEDKREMRLTEEDKFNLASSAKWAEFISIVMFVCIGFVVVACVILLLAVGFAGISANDFGDYSSLYRLPTATTWPMMIAYIVFYLIYLIPTLYMYRFARKTKSAVAAGNEAEMTEAFRNLRGSLKFSGIILIVAIALAFILVIAMTIMAVVQTM